MIVCTISIPTKMFLAPEDGFYQLPEVFALIMICRGLMDCFSLLLLRPQL